MTAYVEQLCRSEKRVKLIEGSLQIGRLLLSNDQAHRRGLTSFRDLASGVVLLGILHVFLLTISVFLLLQVRFRTKWPRPDRSFDFPSYMLLTRLLDSGRVCFFSAVASTPEHPVNPSKQTAGTIKSKRR